jgi:cell wall-associated NlpC family hydrolase
MTGKEAIVAAVAGVILAAAAHSTVAKGIPASLTAAHPPTAAAAQAIAYARAQLGKPYIWGGTGPSGYDCSGLIYEAYASAGVSIPRTSQAQWAGLPHIPASQVQPGDLIFFPGSDGTWSAPGHVALVISATQMEQAYATGTPIEVSPLNGDGAGGIVGYARP